MLTLIQSNLPGDLKLGCIVIDTITTLLGPLLSAVSAQGHAMMIGFMRQLRLFSQSHSCSVLVNMILVPATYFPLINPL